MNGRMQIEVANFGTGQLSWWYWREKTQNTTEHSNRGESHLKFNEFRTQVRG